MIRARRRDRPKALATAAVLSAATALAACGTAISPAPVDNRTYPDTVAARPDTAKPAAPERSALTVKVRPGDGLYTIAKRAKVPLRAIIDANDLKPPYALKPGQRLVLPRPRVHVVGAGDTVYGIAQRYDVGLRNLISANDIRPPFKIIVGQRLFLSAPVGIAASPRPVPRPRTAKARGRLAAKDAAGSVSARSAARRTAPPAKRQTGLRVSPPPIDPPPRQAHAFLWPVKGRLVSAFGAKPGGLHNDGINIAAPRNTEVRAAANGIVAYAGNELRGYGNLLLIRHSGGWITAYAHNDRLLVGRGDVVKRGQGIARVGNSGSVTAPQLHFEIRRGSRAVDPSTLLGRLKRS
jgi:murein DD-endopeptidase MepM/ murein hydrolase activator NlpD